MSNEASHNIGRDKKTPEKAWEEVQKGHWGLRNLKYCGFSDKQAETIKKSLDSDSGNSISIIKGFSLDQYKNLIQENDTKKSKVIKNEIKTQIKREDVWTATNLLNSDIKQPDYIVDNVLMKSGLTVIGGQPGSYKSFLSYDLLLACISNQTFLGIPTQECNCLIIDREMRLSGVKKRINQLSRGREIPEDKLNNLFIISDDSISITHKSNFKSEVDWDSIEYLKGIIKKNNIKIVLFDSLVRFTAGNENDSEDMKLLFNAFSEIMRELNISIILLHHLRKENTNSKRSMDDLRGSSDLSGSPDFIFLTNPGQKTIGFKQVKNRYEQNISEIRLKLIEEIYSNEDKIIQFLPVEKDSPEYEDTSKKGLQEKAESLILELLSDGRKMSATELKMTITTNNHDINEKTVERAYFHLSSNGLIQKDSGHRGKYYTITTNKHDNITTEKNSNHDITTFPYNRNIIRNVCDGVGKSSISISEKNNEEGERLLHDSDKILERL